MEKPIPSHWEINKIQIEALKNSGRLDKYFKQKLVIPEKGARLKNEVIYSHFFDYYIRFEMITSNKNETVGLTYSNEIDATIQEAMIQTASKECYTITKKIMIDTIVYFIYEERHEFKHGIFPNEIPISFMDLFIDMERVQTL